MLALRELEPVDGGAGDTMVDRAWVSRLRARRLAEREARDRLRVCRCTGPDKPEPEPEPEPNTVASCWS